MTKAQIEAWGDDIKSCKAWDKTAAKPPKFDVVVGLSNINAETTTISNLNKADKIKLQNKYGI